ncbi:2Fe-2S iron-sulfur cluster-binding protein [Mycolicibacterium sp. ELW1]|uniref:2Fe-2S iron-sulfur cluster-binding protein n=1 Tax=Mycobacteriaceae TaxID=1762 RepID=UPI0011ECE850|nr:2Fe-2S iron-sulfur cluster-binding protein [Mycobacterium sp. ELW1]QEN16397.1 2Fe-2S iron-sulfur cluster binding domain-containing protein [Mycobacterium sp. ELW1]
MVKVTYVRPSGDVVIVEVAEGTSVMQGAIGNEVSEIVAECGGTLACATCHVYVDEDYVEQLAAPSEDEQEMLDYTASPRMANSRLSCQILVGPELDGLVVRVPPTQL